MKKNILAKKTITTMLGIFLSVGVYADNSVFIDQTGDFNRVTINQDYDGNQVGGVAQGGPSNTNRAVVQGSGNSINIEQIGAGNQLGLSFKNDNTSVPSGSVTALASVNNLNYQVYGTNNTALIDVSAGTGIGADIAYGNNLNIKQYGSGNQVGVQIQGNNNAIDFRTGASGAGNSVDNSVIQSTVTGSSNSQSVVFGGGNSNSAQLQQTGDGNTIGITASGASNQFGVGQDSTAGGAHTFTAGVTGSSNTMSVTQAGPYNSVVNVNVSGSSNAYTINTNAR
jgi:hypothetical protein